MNKEAKEITQPGAQLYEFHIFACAHGRAMYVPLVRTPDGKPIKPFVITDDEVDAYVPQWQLVWGANASMTARKVMMPPNIGLF